MAGIVPAAALPLAMAAAATPTPNHRARPGHSITQTNPSVSRGSTEPGGAGIALVRDLHAPRSPDRDEVDDSRQQEHPERRDPGIERRRHHRENRQAKGKKGKHG